MIVILAIFLHEHNNFSEDNEEFKLGGEDLEKFNQLNYHGMKKNYQQRIDAVVNCTPIDEISLSTTPWMRK